MLGLLTSRPAEAPVDVQQLGKSKVIIMEWVNSAGGPLICADEDFASSWLGTRGLSFRAAGVSNDYELACKTTAHLEIIKEDSRNALVLGDEPFQSSFFETERGDFSIARWIFAESASSEAILMGPLDDLVEVAPRAIFEVDGGVLYLFDSEMPGVKAIVSHPR
jgi:hypothetical protein